MDQNNFLHSKMLTTQEVSDYLRIPVSSLCRLTKTGKIRGFKVGKHWRYRQEDIASFFDGTKKSAGISERRQCARLNSQIPAALHSEIKARDAILPSGVIRNMSQSGCYFSLEHLQAKPFKVNHGRGISVSSSFGFGDPVQIEFKISENESKPWICHGRVVHQTNHGVPGLGVKFRMLTPQQRRVIRNYVG